MTMNNSLATHFTLNHPITRPPNRYNEVNSVPMCANKPFLDVLLRRNWSFTGHVVSDCGAVTNLHLTQRYHNDTSEQGAADALIAGTDINCGSGYTALNASIGQGLVSWPVVDTALSRTLRGRFELGQFDVAQDATFSPTQGPNPKSTQAINPDVVHNPWSRLGLEEVGSTLCTQRICALHASRVLYVMRCTHHSHTKHTR